MDNKLDHVLQIESTCNAIGSFWVKRKMEHRNGSSLEKRHQKKSIYQLFTIIKAANYRYLEFILSFADHRGGKENFIKVTDSVVENVDPYRWLNFFAEHDL